MNFIEIIGSDFSKITLAALSEPHAECCFGGSNVAVTIHDNCLAITTSTTMASNNAMIANTPKEFRLFICLR